MPACGLIVLLGYFDLIILASIRILSPVVGLFDLLASKELLDTVETVVILININIINLNNAGLISFPCPLLLKY